MLSEEKVNELFESCFKDLKRWSEKYHTEKRNKTYNKQRFHLALGNCSALANVLESSSKFSEVFEVNYDFNRKGEEK